MFYGEICIKIGGKIGEKLWRNGFKKYAKKWWKKSVNKCVKKVGAGAGVEKSVKNSGDRNDEKINVKTDKKFNEEIGGKVSGKMQNWQKRKAYELFNISVIWGESLPWVACALKRNMIIKYSPFVLCATYSAAPRSGWKQMWLSNILPFVLSQCIWTNCYTNL